MTLSFEASQDMYPGSSATTGALLNLSRALADASTFFSDVSLKLFGQSSNKKPQVPAALHSCARSGLPLPLPWLAKSPIGKGSRSLSFAFFVLLTTAWAQGGAGCVCSQSCSAFAGRALHAYLHMQVAFAGQVVMASTWSWKQRSGGGSEVTEGDKRSSTLATAMLCGSCSANRANMRRPRFDSKCCRHAQKEYVRQMHAPKLMQANKNHGCALADRWALVRPKKTFRAGWPLSGHAVHVPTDAACITELFFLLKNTRDDGRCAVPASVSWQWIYAYRDVSPARHMYICVAIAGSARFLYKLRIDSWRRAWVPLQAMMALVPLQAKMQSAVWVGLSVCVCLVWVVCSGAVFVLVCLVCMSGCQVWLVCLVWLVRCSLLAWCCLLRLAQRTLPALKPPCRQSCLCKHRCPSGLFSGL